MNLLVNLLSDQTIPNIQFLKKFYQEGDQILLLSTEKMGKKGVGKWLMDAFKLTQDVPGERIETIIADEFDNIDITNQLNSVDYDSFEKILVNVTGGTKVMSLATFEFFRDKKAELYYITGRNNELIKLFPNRNNKNISLGITIGLKEYLLSYGVALEPSGLSGISEDDTNNFLQWFIHQKNEQDYAIIKTIQDKYRGKNCNLQDIPGLPDLLHKISFTAENGAKLTKKHTKYLTGDWLEEYIYFRVKKDIGIADENIETGLNLKKGNVRNEYDVIFVLNNTLYIIECKTYLITEDVKGLVNDTIYKRIASSKELGLFTKNYIVTLNKESELNEANKERAKELGIIILGLESIESGKSLRELLNIPHDAN